MDTNKVTIMNIKPPVSKLKLKIIENAEKSENEYKYRLYKRIMDVALNKK